MSAVPGATEAYLEGMQALKGASLHTASQSLQRAVDLDPQFALARLRLLTLRVLATDVLSSTELQPVRDARAALSKRDQLFLDAVEPWASAPPDYEESRKRFGRALRLYPRDADLHVQMAIALDDSSHPDLALEELKLAVSLDPMLAIAHWVAGMVLSETGADEEALQSLKNCLKVSPAATSCLGSIGGLQATDGKCAELVETSRHLVALAPDRLAYTLLVEGLLGTGRPAGDVQSALEGLLAATMPSARQPDEILTHAAVSIAGGNFEDAERRYAEYTRVETLPHDELQFKARYPQMLLELELGKKAAAVAHAREYLRARRNWTVQADHTLSTAIVQHAAGDISREQLVAARDAWLRGEQDMPSGFRWVAAYAAPVVDGDDASAALLQKPDVTPLIPASITMPSVIEPIGRTYLLAGRAADALPYLARASAMCSPPQGEEILASRRATLELGEAFEKVGNVTSACASYRRASVTAPLLGGLSLRSAKAAADRARQLVCPP